MFLTELSKKSPTSKVCVCGVCGGGRMSLRIYYMVHM